MHLDGFFLSFFLSSSSDHDTLEFNKLFLKNFFFFTFKRSLTPTTAKDPKFTAEWKILKFLTNG